MSYNPYQNRQAASRGQEVKLMEILSRALDVPGEFRLQRDGVVVATFAVSRLPDGSMEFTAVKEMDSPATVPPPRMYEEKAKEYKPPVYVPGCFTGYDMDECD